MRTTIDKAGRIVLPKDLRDRVGLQPGEVEVSVDGSGLHVEPVARGRVVERGGRLVVSGGADPATPLTDDLVRQLRDALQR